MAKVILWPLVAQNNRQGERLTDVARRLIDARGLLPPGARVLVGVSGGADSVALLSVLGDLAAEPGRGYRLTVGHLDHALRADSADDAAFVRELAESRGLPSVVERADVAAQADRTGRGTEDAARMARYGFLAHAAERHGCSHVAVGHHADDNVETILYRLCRGTHLRGLAGIPASRKLSECDATLVRPLLEARREEIEAYCRRRGLAWRTDPTNRHTGYRRNFIRNELLPLLRERLNARVDDALLRLAAGAAEVEQWAEAGAAAALDRAVESAGPSRIVLCRDGLRPLSPVVLRYVLRLASERAGVPLRMLGAARLEEMAEVVADDGPAAAALPGGFEARRDGERVVIAPASGPAGVDAGLAATPLATPGVNVLGDGRRIECRVEPLDRREFEAFARARATGKRPDEAWLDADALRGRLVARGRREGDAFVPLGAPGRQTVSDFLTNVKAPADERERIACVCDDLGIVWLAPRRIDDRVKVTDATLRVTKLRLLS